MTLFTLSIVVFIPGLYLSAGSVDTRCPVNQSHGWTSECSNNMRVVWFVDSEIYLHPKYTLSPTQNYTIYTQEHSGDCRCDCNGDDIVQSTNISWGGANTIIKIEVGSVDSGCYQFIIAPDNLRSCCIYFPVKDDEDNSILAPSPLSLPTKSSSTMETPPHTSSTDLLFISKVIGAVCLLVFAAVILICFAFYCHLLHQQQKTNKSLQDDFNFSVSSGKEEHVLLIYAGDCHYFQSIVNCLKNCLEGAIKCKVDDMHGCAAEVCDEGAIPWLHRKVKECSKVIVLLSPAAVKLQSVENQSDHLTVYETVSKYFFSELLILPQAQKFKEKLINVSLEIFGTLSATGVLADAVYALPTKLEDVLKHLAPHAKFDEGKLQECVRDLSLELEKYSRIQGNKVSVDSHYQQNCYV